MITKRKKKQDKKLTLLRLLPERPLAPALLWSPVLFSLLPNRLALSRKNVREQQLQAEVQHLGLVVDRVVVTVLT